MPVHNISDELSSQHAEFPASGRMIFVTGIGFMQAWGPTVPGDGATGYGKGCVFMHTDAADATDVVYVNTGDTTSSLFAKYTTTLTSGQGSDIVTNASDITTVTSNLIYVLGTGASVQNLVKAKSRLDTVKSNVTWMESDIDTNTSDITSLESNLVSKITGISASTVEKAFSTIDARLSNYEVLESNLVTKVLGASASSAEKVFSTIEARISNYEVLQSNLVAEITGISASTAEKAFSTIEVGLSDVRYIKTEVNNVSDAVLAVTSDLVLTDAIVSAVSDAVLKVASDLVLTDAELDAVSDIAVTNSDDFASMKSDMMFWIHGASASTFQAVLSTIEARLT